MTSDRLSVIDDIFLRTHRGFGIPIVLQGVWRSDETVDRVELAAVHANLSVGRLGHRVVTPRFPLARRRWTPSTDSLPLDYDTTPLAATDIVEWADAQGECELDPEYGPGWRLSARLTDNGGTVCSLVCSHALADARGLITAAGRAIEGRAFEGSGPLQNVSRHHTDPVDAVALVWRVTRDALRAIVGLWISRESRRELYSYLRRPSTPSTHELASSSAIFDIEGSVSNSEFIAIVTEIMVALGHPEPVGINVPFRSDTPGANGIGMATVRIWRSDSVADIRDACRRAFRAPVGAPSGFPAETVQLLPDRIAAALTTMPGGAAAMCSNIGDLPRSVNAIGTHPATTVATRALHPHARSARTTTSLSAYISTTGARTTLSLVGTDAQLIPSAEILTACAQEVLTGRRLTARSWR